jgi:predicted secreted protein
MPERMPMSEQRTARETLDELIERAEVMLMSRSHPPNAENLAADLDERTQLGYDLLASLRAAPRAA